MALFRIAGKADKLERINIRRFSNEREMQRITKNNLKQIFGLDFLCSEFRFGTTHKPNQNRIDILAFDSKSKSFVIIECKNKAIHGAIEQGRRYLNQIKPCQVIFYGNYQKKIKNHMMMDDIDWDKSKLILVATEYTNNQRGAVDGDDPQTELWEIKRYQNNTVSFSRVDKAISDADSEYMFATQKKVPSKPPGETTDVIYDPIEKKRLENATEKMADLYKKFRKSILNLSDKIKVKGRESYLGFDTNANVVGIRINAQQLNIWINMKKGELKNAKKMENLAGKNHNGNGDYGISVNSDENLKYILRLVKQSLKHHSSKKKTKERRKNLTKSLTEGRFTEEHHIEMGSKEIVALYKRLKRDIIGDIEIRCNKRYMSLMTNDIIIAYILIRQDKLKIKINIPKGKLKGSKKVMRDASEIGSWPYADYDKDIKSDISDKELKRIVGFVAQSLKFKGEKRSVRTR